MDWDDLRYIIAVADKGTAIAAAQHLEVNATTVQRRIARFEKQNGVHLFERRHSGLTPTPECEALVSATRSIQETVSGIRREILGRDLRLEGRLAVTSTDTFMLTTIAKHLNDFKKLHPNIRLDVTLTNSRLDLSRQDADIAIRPSRNPPAHLVGQRVSDLAVAIYCAKNRRNDFPAMPSMAQLANEDWVGLGDALRGAPTFAWMEQHIPETSIGITVDTFVGMASAMAAGYGLGMLPCILGDTHPELVRVSGPIEELQTSIWVLTHPEIKTAAKVRAFMDFITKAIRQDAPLLSGQAGPI